jgi:RNA 2',3'-cyclic 3'-phosphodiesterase
VRLFVAIEMLEDIRARYAAFLKEMRLIAPRVKWVRAENLHVTLKFLGHTDPARLAAIQDALATAHCAEPVTLEFRGLGFFPDEKRPRVFWAGMTASPNLKPLAAEIDRAVHSCGFAREERAFTPHLTLARFDPPGLPGKLGVAAHENANRRFGAFTTGKFHLIESKLKPTGAEYTTLHSFAFVAEA